MKLKVASLSRDLHSNYLILISLFASRDLQLNICLTLIKVKVFFIAMTFLWKSGSHKKNFQQVTDS